mmetsp:Transcript_10119/g.31190  ORF Transcript_10119/g.31190 Transcript_10119/m.31190 type:complete len:230 (+) Transcript_10119:764-1453(+)
MNLICDCLRGTCAICCTAAGVAPCHRRCCLGDAVRHRTTGASTALGLRAGLFRRGPLCGSRNRGRSLHRRGPNPAVCRRRCRHVRAVASWAFVDRHGFSEGDNGGWSTLDSGRQEPLARPRNRGSGIDRFVRTDQLPALQTQANSAALSETGCAHSGGVHRLRSWSRRGWQHGWGRSGGCMARGDLVWLSLGTSSGSCERHAFGGCFEPSGGSLHRLSNSGDRTLELIV